MAAALTPSRLQNAEHYFTNHAVALPGGVSLEDALKPAFWAHCAAQIRQGDILRLMPEDDSYFAEALVRSRGTGFAKLVLLRHVPFDDATAEVGADDLVKVEFKGPHLKHCIIRCSDGHILKDSVPLKADALREALDYARRAT